MIKPKEHEREAERLDELDSYSILDSLPEEDYDNITQIAAEICNTEISLISLVDDKRQWFKSRHGITAEETPKEISFCGHAINDAHENNRNLFLVEDARTDKRFYDNPLVTGEPKIVFYAGVPLMSENGLPLGTLCVIDKESKSLTKNQLKSLNALANQVMNTLNLRKTKLKLEQTLQAMEVKNQALEHFAHVAAHDLKSPLRSISGISMLLTKKYASKIDSKGVDLLGIIKDSAKQLSTLIDGLLDYSKNEKALHKNKSILKIKELEKDILGLFNYGKETTISFNTSIDEVVINKTVLLQILINLIGNAIKYNHKDEVKVEVGIGSSTSHYDFYVQDNGPGIPAENQEKMFNLFNGTDQKDRYGESGKGIGLATVKKLVEVCGGSIQVQSKMNEGTKFSFTIQK